MGTPVTSRDTVERLIADQRRRLVELAQCSYELDHAQTPIAAARLYDRLCFLRDDVLLRADRIIACLEELSGEERVALFRWQFGDDLIDLESLMRDMRDEPR